MEKTVHLLRHAEGYHNVQGEILIQLMDYRGIIFEGRWRRLRLHHLVRIICSIWRLLYGLILGSLMIQGSAKCASTKNTSCIPYEHLDASLTETGWEQVAERRKSMAKTKVELVVVSPLKRTLQTAAGVFGGRKYKNGETLPPLMADKVGRSPQLAISSAGCPPFLATELCREHISNFPCDKRSRLSECKKDFPAVDLSEIELEEDSMWNATRPESDKELSARVEAFVQWLWNRPEKEIAVVSHGGFLATLLSLYGGADIDACSRFANCELRTVKMRGTDLGSQSVELTQLNQTSSMFE